MRTSSTSTEPAFPLLMFCAACGALVASSCSSKIDGFVSLGSDTGGAAGGGASSGVGVLASGEAQLGFPRRHDPKRKRRRVSPSGAVVPNDLPNY